MGTHLAIWLHLVILCALIRNSTGVSIQGRKAKTKTRVVLRINKFISCPGSEEWNGLNLTMSRSVPLPNGLYSSDLDGDLKIELPKVATVHGKFEKCSEAVSSNTCEYYKSVTFENIDLCSAMRMPGAFWSKWFDSLQPPIDCPPKPGFYTNRNFSLDVDWLDRMGFPLVNNVWIVTAKVIDKTKRPLLCTQSESNFFRVRQ